MSPEEIPVPLGARIRALPHFRDRVRLPANEIEPTTLRMVARRSGRGAVRCLARYHEGYISVILLRYRRGLQDEAEKLRKALRTAYPRERIELEEDPQPNKNGNVEDLERSGGLIHGGHGAQYYHLRKEGRKALRAETQQWMTVHETLTKLWRKQPRLS